MIREDGIWGNVGDRLNCYLWDEAQAIKVSASIRGNLILQTVPKPQEDRIIPRNKSQKRIAKIKKRHLREEKFAFSYIQRGLTL